MNNIEKGKISSSQLFFAVMCYFQGSTLLTGFYVGITGRDSWVILISGYLVALIFIWCFIQLTKAYPGKNLIQISEEVFGPVFGKIVSFCYFFYFASIVILNLELYGGFVQGNVLSETPFTIILIPIVFICVWIARKGVENVVRYGAAFFVFWAFIYIIVFVLSFKEFNFTNLAPVFTLTLREFIHGTHVSATIPYGDLVIFLMLTSSVNDQSKVAPAIYLGMTFGMISLILVVVSDISVLGGLTPVMTTPTYEALRVINVGEIFSRMEILFMVVRLILQFFKIGLVFYAAVLSFAQMCGLKSYRSIATVLGALMIVYTLVTFNHAGEHAAWGNDTAPFFSSFFEFFLPALTLLVLTVKKKLKKSRANQAAE